VNPIPGSFHNRPQKGDGRPFAIGACNMNNGRETVLGPVKPI
jgi:hypothetical protein